MSKKHVAIYLNDHLAGALAAVEVLEKLESAHGPGEIGEFARKLRVDIAMDRATLEEFMRSLDIAQSIPRKMAAWISEKFTELKLKTEDSADGSFRLLEALDLVSTGISGKAALWRSLDAAAKGTSEFRSLDFKRLLERAQEQLDRVEVFRLGAASQVLNISAK